MSGIVFYRTINREKIVQWYTRRLNASVWLEQPGCTILQFEGFRFGFCDADKSETESILTFVFDTIEEVDMMHDRLQDAALEEPHENEKYNIYQFFSEDPDGRKVEIQTFLHETPEIP
jgi:predicted lactoylglutathione lyase